MSQKKMNEGLPAFEAALASLSPAASAIDRDRLMYLAGQAVGVKSPQRRFVAKWLWPCATAASVLLAVTLTGVMLGRGPQIVEKIVYVPAEAPAIQPGTPTSPKKIDKAPRRTKRIRGDYLQLRRMVVAQGVDALPKLKQKPTSGAKIPKWAPGARTELERSLGS
jgi:hypothetical protein